ncbi:glycosyltransferase family 2 protein [Bacillus aquiflavi]|uniref:glycosyltransferase family 2 protein n=1 Tax=Bacillus aquiflavi TaxID=2672567 RepID=UPI001CA8BDE7|nr:glycosyltransferase [Bacillus aquiflavi]UAC49812.1 glycosyltransferase family 2 protein [Bacillus aquiflavi]
MGLIITICLYCVFFIFQALYIFVPLFTVKGNRFKEKLDKEKGMSVLIPAYNEENIIKNCIQAILHVDYKNYEAFIINDGSTDKTMELLQSLLVLETVEKEKAGKLKHKKIKGIYQSTVYPNIYVIDKENGGKADSLNAGIEYAKFDNIITLDADSSLDVNSLQAINSAFRDEKVIAAGGMVHIGQTFHGDYTNPKPFFKVSNLLKFQFIQYLANFYLYKITQTKFNALAIISGAFGVFKKDALFEVGGYRITVGEDMDITMRIQRLIKTKYKDRKILFIPEAVCFTEGPETLRDLFKQRIRWQKAFIDCIIIYGKSLFTKFGLSMSLFLLVDSLLLGTLTAFPTLIIPFIILFSGNGAHLALMLFCFSFSLGVFQSIVALIITNRYGYKFKGFDRVRLSLFVPFEIVTYRFLGVLFNTFGTVGYFINKNSWNKVERVGTNNQTYSSDLSSDGKVVPINRNKKKVG